MLGVEVLNAISSEGHIRNHTLYVKFSGNTTCDVLLATSGANRNGSIKGPSVCNVCDTWVIISLKDISDGILTLGLLEEQTSSITALYKVGHSSVYFLIIGYKCTVETSVFHPLVYRFVIWEEHF